jgi:hypothetical protein
MTELSVSYRPVLRDILHAARIAEGENWWTASRVATGLLSLFGAALFYLGFRWWSALWFGLAIAEYFNLLPMSVLVAYIEFKRNPKYRQEYHLTLSPETLSFRTETISTVLKWSHYKRFWETERAFVLASGEGVPAVIPKAAFATEAECNRARAILQDAIFREPSRE